MAKQKVEQKIITPEKKKPAVESTVRSAKFYAIIIFIFSFLIYINSISNDYNLDDELVTQNQKVTSRGWDVLKLNFDVFGKKEFEDSTFATELKFFMPTVFRVPYYEDRSGYRYEYRPMVLFSFAFEHMIFAQKDVINGTEVSVDNPHISHFFNVLFYSALCLLLFFVLQKLLTGYDIIFPFLITILFAAHPIHTEVVASIKNRDEIMALIFGLLSLWFAIKFIENNRAWHLILVVLFFLLGILSKPTTITFAVLIPLALAMLTNATWRNAMLITALLAIPAIFYARLYSLTQQIELGVVLLSATSGFYLLKNFEFVWAYLKNVLSEIYSPTKISGAGTDITQPMVQPGWDVFRKPANILLTLFVILPVLLLAFGGIYLGNVWLACMPLILLAIGYIVGTDDIKLLLITPISLAAISVAVKFNVDSRPVESILLIFLANQFFSQNRVFRIVAIGNYVLYVLVAVALMHSVYFVVAIIFAGIYYKKVFPVSAVLLALAAALFFKKIFGVLGGGHTFDYGYLNWPLFILGFILLWRKLYKVLNWVSVSLLPVLLIGYFASTFYVHHSTPAQAVKNGYYNVQSIKAADLTPVQSIRPLRYVEFPIEKTDPASIKIGTAMSVMGKYLKLVVLPYPMSYYYGYACITPVSITNPGPLFSLFAYLLLLLVAGLYFFRKNSLLSFSILFYLASISVFSNLVFPIPGLMGDRFLLIPSIGFCIFAVLILAIIFKQDLSASKANPTLVRSFTYCLAAITLLYSITTFARNFNWKDRLTLFRHDISVVENSAQAQNLLGFHLLNTSMHERDPLNQKQLREEAIPHFQKALEIYPQFLNASFDLGRTYEGLQRFDEAYEQYRKTIVIDSSFTTPYYGMGTIEDYRNNYAAAIPLYERFLRRAPTNMEVYTNLSFDYFRIGQYDKSIEVNRSALKYQPANFNALVNIGKTYLKVNQPDSALFYFEKAHLAHPEDRDVETAVQQMRAQVKHQ